MLTVNNRGPDAATLHLLPNLWFRNTWALKEGSLRPTLGASDGVVVASHADLGGYVLEADGAPELLFTDNETNTQLLWGQQNATPFVKDAFHRYVIDSERDAVNPERVGTKAAAHYALEVPGGGESVVRLRLRSSTSAATGSAFEANFRRRSPLANEKPTSSTSGSCPRRSTLTSG